MDIKTKNRINGLRRKVNNRFFVKLWKRISIRTALFMKSEKLWFSPEILMLDITGYCNMKCLVCPQSVPGIIRERGIMDMETYKLVIDKGHAAKIPFLILSFTGEPLLHRQLEEMIAYAKKNRFFVSLVTNCTLLNSERSLKLIQSGLDDIQLSFDTLNKEAFDKYRGVGFFETALENIRGFLELRKKLGVRKPSVMIQNLQAAKGKNHHLSIEPDFLDEFGKYRKVWIMPKYFSTLSTLKNNDQDPAIYSESLIDDTSRYRLCKAIYQRFAVSWDGKAVSCCIDFPRSQIMGDVKNSGIMDIWNGGKFQRLRKKIAEQNIQDLPRCSQCGDLWY